MASQAGIPIRIYKKKELFFYYCPIELVKDPIIPYEEKIKTIQGSIGYFITPHFHYYGIVNSKDYEVVLGPSRQLRTDPEDLKSLARECSVPMEEREGFVRSRKSLALLPLNTILQMLCSLNFVLNGEKLSLSDLTIYDEEQRKIADDLNSQQRKKKYESPNKPCMAIYSTYAQEQNILSFVRHGDVSALKEWTSNPPNIDTGVLSKDPLRQRKNRFIVTTTLVSRSAIRGGRDVEDSLHLSDAYIQKCELLTTVEDTSNLQFHRVFDYAERVEKLRFGKNPSKLITDIANYVHKHLSEPVNIDALAKARYRSRTRLAVKFKQETGRTLTDFFLKEKIEEGKRMLKYTDKSIAAISAYLGFSSQSHFSNVFKKYVGQSPNEYRIKHSK